MSKEDQPIKTIPKEKALSKMAQLCARREYSIWDIRLKLSRYNLDERTIDEIIEELVKQRYIDELRFTRSFINDKLRFNKWGKIKIVFALKQKQIPKQVVAEAFKDYSEEELNKELLQLLQAKWKTIKGKSEYERKNKLISFALNRGFEMNHILQCFSKVE